MSVNDKKDREGTTKGRKIFGDYYRWGPCKGATAKYKLVRTVRTSF